MFPGRAPDGHVTLTVFIGGARHQPPGVCLARNVAGGDLADACRTVLGVVGTPTYVQHIFWDKAVPQYELGYGNMQGIMAQLETQYPGFFVASNYRQGIAIGDALTSGYAAAERIACEPRQPIQQGGMRGRSTWSRLECCLLNFGGPQKAAEVNPSSYTSLQIASSFVPLWAGVCVGFWPAASPIKNSRNGAAIQRHRLFADQRVYTTPG